MPSTAPWARYDPRIRFVIDGKEMPCVRCSVDYEMNAIPQASATIAVGRGFDGQPSPVHALAANFVDRAPAQIYINPNALGQDARSAMGPDDLGLSGNEVRIFDGFVTGAGFTRSRGQAQFNVQMEHWLSELGFSSIFSKSSHPSNPGQYSYSALGPMGSAGGTWTNDNRASEFATASNVAADLWGKVMKPFFVKICEFDAFWSWDPHVEVKGANDGALAALNRFSKGKCQQALALDLSTDADLVSNIAQHISDAVSTPAKITHQTLWDVLVSTFSSEYLFKVIPRVEDAIVAPFVPGYRAPFATITSNEEVTIEWMRALGRPLRGVGILADARSTSGALAPGEGSPSDLRMAGFYTPSKDAKGIIIIKEGPEWMTRLYTPSLYSSASTGVSGTAIGTAVQPGGGTSPGVPDAVAAKLKNVVRPFLDRYCKALYAIEKLRPRQAVCSGPFRLDIAPGSTVKVENEGETHIGADPLAAPFYAHVVRVSLGVDGEQPSIGTSFQLSHIRSEKENGDERTSVEKHPLYQQTFSGCTLVDL